MKKLLAIAFKDAKTRFTSLPDWLFFLILPVVFTVVLAGGTGGEGGDSRIRLMVVDQANTPLSADLVKVLEDSASVVPELATLKKAEDQFSQRRVSAILVIPAEFDLEHMQEGKLDLEIRKRPNSLNAMVAERAVQAVISRVSAAVDIARASTEKAESIRPFASDAERQVYFDEARIEAQNMLEEAPTRLTETEAETSDQIEYDPATNSSIGQMITWVFIPLIGLSELFAYERQKGTLRRILISPTRKSTYLFGTISGQVVWALVQMTLLVGFGMLVMKVNYSRDLGGLVIMLVAGCLAAAALGTMLGTMVKTAGQANGLSIMLGMVMALLGGCWYPLEMFPQAVQSAVKVLPTTWMMNGMLDLALRNKGLVDILPEAGVLLGFALVFFVIGIWRFKYE